MCGIAGLVNPGGLTEEQRHAIGPMVAVLHHRGPDDSDTYCDGMAALGHARLSIIDIASGRQPLSNEDNSIWITFNGEIYNFQELRERLIARGHRFRTRSDSEVIVHLYEEEGEACVESLRGMFAFVIWDSRRRIFFLARDRVGIKPVYYTQFGGTLAFASELKALAEVPGLPRDVDPQALADYLTYMWIPAPKTIFQNICKLPAGHTATFDANGLRLRQYWDLTDFEPVERDETTLIEEFRERLTEAVRLRLIAEVDLGAFLSGGLDSSAVVATMAALSERPVRTHSIGFAESRFSEVVYSDRVAEKFGTEHHRHFVQPDAAGIVDRLAWYFDEPFADSSAVPTYYVSQCAREHVTVALSGDGGDENMAGYRKYRFTQRQRGVRRVGPGPRRRAIFGPLGRVYPKADWLPSIFRAKNTFQELAGSDLDAIYLSRAVVHPAVSWRLLSADVRKQLGDYNPRSVIESHYNRCNASDPLNRELYTDIKTYLVDDILTKVDRASMAVSLEVRVPLLDHRLMEFLAKVPTKWKLHRGVGKVLFKNAFRNELGSDIVDRPKQGFTVPLAQWLRGPLRSMVEETVFADDARVRSWLDMNAVRSLWSSHLRGTGDMGSMIWAVLMLEHWARNFLPAGSSAAARPIAASPAAVVSLS